MCNKCTLLNVSLSHLPAIYYHIIDSKGILHRICLMRGTHVHHCLQMSVSRDCISAQTASLYAYHTLCHLQRMSNDLLLKLQTCNVLHDSSTWMA